MAEPIKTAVAYARFSSENQREESLDAQVRGIQDYANRNGFVILKIYADRAVSARTDQRPEFQRMFSDIRNGIVVPNAILVHKFDRFSRDRADSAVYKRELKQRGMRLISVLEAVDDSPESIILEGLLESLAEYYSRNLSREVLKGLRENALKCASTGGCPPLGYDIDPETKKYIINEREAEAVRLIFKRYLEGEGYSAIINELNSSGYKTKRGKAFGKNSLHEVLKQRRYTGTYIYRFHPENLPKSQYHHRRLPLSEDDIVIPDGMPVIISDEDFEKVQEKMKLRQHKAATFKAKQDYLLSGKIVCGECGSAYAGNSRKPNPTHPLYVSYRCTKKNGAVKCKNPEIARDLLEETVLKALANTVFNEAVLPRLLDKYNDYAIKRNEESIRALEGAKKQLKVVNNSIENIINVMAQTGSIALAEKLKSLEAEKLLLESTIRAEECKLAATKINTRKLKAAFNQAKHQLAHGTLKNKKAIAEQYVKEVRIYKERIEVTFNVIPGFPLTQNINRDELKK